MNTPKVSIVVAIDSKRGIGKNNQLMWHIPEDLKRFKQITHGHPIIMGRKTYQSIGKPLPGRTNIIITRDKSFQESGCIVVHSLDEALEEAKKHDQEEIFVIGGGQIFEEALPLIDKIYLTIVEGDFGADVFFPDYSAFQNVTFKETHNDEKYTYTFINLEK